MRVSKACRVYECQWFVGCMWVSKACSVWVSKACRVCVELFVQVHLQISILLS